MNIQVAFDPYSGITASQVTSNVIDLRDAEAATLSCYTSAGTGSLFTVQLSNSTPDLVNGQPPEASWVDQFAVSTKTRVAFPDASRYARVLRLPSQASWVMDVVKHVR